MRRARDYRWSSAALHCGGRDPGERVDRAVWRKHWRRGNWTNVLNSLEESEVAALRRHTQTGRPWGSAAFVARLERQTGRELHARPVGRPRKTERGEGNR
ncbi:MAG: hypothetical protein AMXMBFR13_26410 [Phycisphaerae bacterium]